jgi:vacuolar iron transporter family protein
MDTQLYHDHVESHLKSAALLRNIVIGISNDLNVPFSLASGLSNTVENSSSILIAGIAEIAAGT